MQTLAASTASNSNRPLVLWQLTGLINLTLTPINGGREREWREEAKSREEEQKERRGEILWNEEERTEGKMK